MAVHRVVHMWYSATYVSARTPLRSSYSRRGYRYTDVGLVSTYCQCVHQKKHHEAQGTHAPAACGHFGTLSGTGTKVAFAQPVAQESRRVRFCDNLDPELILDQFGARTVHCDFDCKWESLRNVWTSSSSDP